jgi:hypothetical protein
MMVKLAKTNPKFPQDDGKGFEAPRRLRTFATEPFRVAGSISEGVGESGAGSHPARPPLRVLCQ